MIIKVNKHRGQYATVKILGDEYRVKLDDNSRAELSLYGSTYTIVGIVKPKAKYIAKKEK